MIYPIRVEQDIWFGRDLNFAGYETDLLLDIYKPVNTDTLRPILIYVHGGAWLGGDKSLNEGKWMPEAFAKMGYVAATIRYRLGMFTDPNMVPGQNCSLAQAEGRCLYIQDSLEVYRALFRGIQDAKAAIRFMKERAALDSSCSTTCFIAGESAGGFISMGATFMDEDVEKFNACHKIADALPANQILSFCENVFNHVPRGQKANYERPDLGSVRGKNNINGYSEKVLGVANYYGGMFDEALTKRWIKGNENILIYQFHQTNDPVVPCNSQYLLSGLNTCMPLIPFNDCKAFRSWVKGEGSCAVEKYLKQINYPSALIKTEIISNWIGVDLIDCYNITQAGQGHTFDNLSLRAKNAALHWRDRILKEQQNCRATQVENKEKDNTLLQIYFLESSLYIEQQVYSQLDIYNIAGQKIFQGYLQKGVTYINLDVPKNQILFVRLSNKVGQFYMEKISTP